MNQQSGKTVVRDNMMCYATYEILRPKLNNKLTEFFFSTNSDLCCNFNFLIVNEQWRTLPEMETSQANHQRE